MVKEFNYFNSILRLLIISKISIPSFFRDNDYDDLIPSNITLIFKQIIQGQKKVYDNAQNDNHMNLQGCMAICFLI